MLVLFLYLFWLHAQEHLWNRNNPNISSSSLFLPLNLMAFAFLSCFQTTALKKQNFNSTHFWILFSKGIICCVMVDESLHNYYLGKKERQNTCENWLTHPAHSQTCSIPVCQFHLSCVGEHFAHLCTWGVPGPLQVQQSSSWEQAEGEPSIHLFNIYSTRLFNHEEPLIYRHGSWVKEKSWPLGGVKTNTDNRCVSIQEATWGLSNPQQVSHGDATIAIWQIKQRPGFWDTEGFSWS